MSNDTRPQWEEVERVMSALLELPETEHAPYLAKQPPAIRGEVESLLAAYARSGNFLSDVTSLQSGGMRFLGEVAPSQARADCNPGPSLAAIAGVQLGAYRIEAVLGEGGMGVVYRAHDTKLNRPVAVKFLSDDLADPAARRRFQREAQTGSSLNHPHIVTVHDAGEFQGRQYLVTELVDGGALENWAGAEKRTWQQILEILVGVADGLAAAHAAGILHRDIKPANI